MRWGAWSVSQFLCDYCLAKLNSPELDMVAHLGEWRQEDQGQS